METTLYILLTIALVSRPTLCTPAPEEANSDEGREQTQIDQLYQIYKATQNNIIQLNTEVSLINYQLAELREKSASKSKVDGELSDLSSTVKSNLRQLLKDFQHLENEVELNVSRKMDRAEVIAVTDSLQSSVSSLNTANEATTTQLNSLQSSMSSLTTRVNSPVNLYQNCIQETRSCTIGPRTTDIYWAWCYTDYQPISKAVSLVWALSTHNHQRKCGQSNKWTLLVSLQSHQ